MTAKLIYVVGASGSGKDSLMQYCRDQLAANKNIQFMHRYITRSAQAGGENHVQLSEQEFAGRKEAGLFSLHWSSHGHHYGIGIEINQWLEKGITVVVNGSREYLAEVKHRYPNLLPVWIEVSPEILQQRLWSRGRENDALIQARLARHQQIDASPHEGVVICNDGPLSEAGSAMITAILSASK